ncbi:MAG: hypothetical protein Q9169_006080 [Polycauliona sp. 2 TL-2023]
MEDECDELTDDLAETTEGHDRHVNPGFPFDALDYLSNQTGAEDGEEENGRSKARPVAIGGCFDDAEVGHGDAVIDLRDLKLSARDVPEGRAFELATETYQGLAANTTDGTGIWSKACDDWSRIDHHWYRLHIRRVTICAREAEGLSFAINAATWLHLAARTSTSATPKSVLKRYLHLLECVLYPELPTLSPRFVSTITSVDSSKTASPDKPIMVYGGKPSAGCKNCRKRKIKCDEQRPSCTQCTTSNRVCPGYAHLFDLVLRDQTESVTRKAQRKGKRGSANAKASANAASKPVTAVVAGYSDRQRPIGSFRTSSSHIASPTHSGNILPLSLPRSFHDSPQDQAINGFFLNYVLIPRHHHSRRGYLDCLLPLYQGTRHDSLLSLATTAMALAIEGGSPSTAHYRQLSHSFFGRALVKTSRAIRDPVESTTDETLMAVLLLSFYERVLATSEAKPISGVHDTGAVALVKHRGKQNGNSETSARLLLAVQTQVTSSPFAKTSADLDSMRPDVFENAASRLTSLSARLSDLTAFAYPQLMNIKQFPTHEQLMSILDYAGEVEDQLATWPATVPDDWHWKASHTFDNLPSQESKLYVYNRRVDIYHDIWVASIWNSYRGTMLLIQYCTLQCLGMLNPPPLSTFAYRIVTAINKVQELVDDICGSVPFNLGTKTFGGPSDRIEIQYPDDGITKPSSDYRKSAAGLGGWFIIEPLKIASKAISLRDGQQDWILKQIERIQRIYTIKKPIDDPTSSMPSPRCPGGRG